MSNDKKKTMIQMIISGIKYFIIMIAFIGPILSIGNVINDVKHINSTIITKTSDFIYDTYHPQEWFSDDEVSFPEKYINDADNVADCPYDNCNIDLDIMLIGIGICSVGSISLLLLNAFSIISENNRRYDRYIELCDEMDDDDRPYISKAFSTRVNIRSINPKLMIILPIIVFIISIISVNLIIYQYGSRISNNINGIIRRYGLEYSETAMDTINNIDEFDVSIKVSLHPNHIANDHNDDIRSIIKSSGTYFRGTKVINHRMIPYGMIVCVTIDMINYYNIILAHVILLIVYFVNFWMLSIENSHIFKFRMNNHARKRG